MVSPGEQDSGIDNSEVGAFECQLYIAHNSVSSNLATGHVMILGRQKKPEIEQ
jgi:hypothetical protein